MGDKATKSVSLEVMDYAPVTLYADSPFYWGYIDDAFRSASQRGVQVRLMFAVWNHTRPEMLQYWRSLNELDNIELRVFVVPPNNGYQVPYTRVNHAKFIVSDSHVAVCTNNWTPDYFLYS